MATVDQCRKLICNLLMQQDARMYITSISMKMRASIEKDSSSICIIIIIMNPSQLNSSSMAQQKYKVVFLGDSGVGKSSIIDRFVKGEIDCQNQPTVGIDFLSRNIVIRGTLLLDLGKTYKLQLWDTAGQQKYKSLVPAYLKDANCGILVFETDRKQTFKNLRGWLSLLRDHAPSNAMVILVANKADLLQLSNSQYMDEVKTFKMQEQLLLIQVSAKTGLNIEVIFETMIQKLHMQELKTGQGVICEQVDEEQKGAKTFCVKYNRAEFDYSRKLRCCHI